MPRPRSGPHSAHPAQHRPPRRQSVEDWLDRRYLSDLETRRRREDGIARHTLDTSGW